VLRIQLDEVIACLTEGRGRLVDHRMTMAQYVPEARVCARVDVRFEPYFGASVVSQALYAKSNVERDGAMQHVLMEAFHDAAMKSNGRLSTPRPVLWQPKSGLHWQLAVSGQTLNVVDPAIGPTSSARVGRQLALFHATPIPRTERRGTSVGLRMHPRTVVDLLLQVEPAWKDTLERLMHYLDVGVTGLRGHARVTLHGDLHPRNILVAGERFTFIDLDSAHHGYAVIELGAWVADAFNRSLLSGAPLEQALPSIRAFLSAYEDASGFRPSEALLAWSTAHHLLCQRIYRCVANLKPGRVEAVPRLLAITDAIASAGSIGAVESVVTELVAAPPPEVAHTVSIV
jgi:thiamine kinase-like enzyme